MSATNQTGDYELLERARRAQQEAFAKSQASTFGDGEGTYQLQPPQRKYLPTFAELVDRLSIVTLKSIFIPKNKEAYDKEAQDIMHDIDMIIKEKNIILNAEALRAIQVIQLANRYIWENESKCREGSSQDLSLLKLTHSINGVRNTAKNVLSAQLGERVDLKIDCLAAELKSDFQNWDIFK